MTKITYNCSSGNPRGQLLSQQMDTRLVSQELSRRIKSLGQSESERRSQTTTRTPVIRYWSEGNPKKFYARVNIALSSSVVYEPTCYSVRMRKFLLRRKKSCAYCNRPTLFNLPPDCKRFFSHFLKKYLQRKIKTVKAQKVKSIHKYSVILAFCFLYKNKMYAGEA